MIYKELKNVILRQLAQAKGQELPTTYVYNSMLGAYPNEKGIRKKTYWALNELLAEKLIERKGPKILIKKASNTLGISNLFGKKFERECKKLLELAGFQNVRVFGKTGDRGVDGKAELPVQGLFKMAFYFQCKNTQARTGSPAIREFRGSIINRCAAGIYFSAGGFTKEATISAQTNQNPPIYLVDQTLINKINKHQYT